MNKKFKLDTVDIPKCLEDFHITKFFLETKAGHTTTLSWLQSLNTSTLELLVTIAQRGIHSVDLMQDESFIKKMDEETENMSEAEHLEGADVFILSFLVEDMENGREPNYDNILDENTPLDVSMNKMKNLYVIALFEYLRRHGLVKLNGTGMVTDGEETNMKMICEPEELVEFIERTGIGGWMLE